MCTFGRADAFGTAPINEVDILELKRAFSIIYSAEISTRDILVWKKSKYTLGFGS